MVNAIQRLRGRINADALALGLAADDSDADLSAVDALYQAATRVGEADNPALAEWPVTERGEAAFTEMMDALAALAAAVRRVDGEATESTVPWDKRFGA